jgi:predicted ATP-grasp superfamily ATP-dependent carboligase
MQELAERARTIAEEIKKLSEELEKVAGMGS